MATASKTSRLLSSFAAAALANITLVIYLFSLILSAKLLFFLCECVCVFFCLEQCYEINKLENFTALANL